MYLRHRPLRIAEDGSGHRAGGLLRVAARCAGVNPRISHLINLDLHLWVHDKGTGAMLAEIPVPQNASGSETTDYLMPYGILRGAPWPGCLSRSSLRYQWVVARLPASSPGIRDDFDSGAVADVYE